jgi:uncharacterized membrane protein YqhA
MYCERAQSTEGRVDWLSKGDLKDKKREIRNKIIVTPRFLFLEILLKMRQRETNPLILMYIASIP